jgi:3-phosphoshikimate 1-carboxyvinyltransferase
MVPKANKPVNMKKTVSPSAVKGRIKAPASKSMTQRAIAAALLSEGETTVLNPSFCNDSLAAMGLAEGLGATVKRNRDELKISGGKELRVKRLDCGESGLAIRMFSPIAALHPEEIIISGTGSLRTRPMTMIEDALRQFGVQCNSSSGLLPLTIKGPLPGGDCEIDGSISSQLLTGLLMALPAAGMDSTVRVMDLKSRPYIDMTLQVLEKFGIKAINDHYSKFLIPGNQKYRACSFEVESDWSGGAFLLVAGAIAGEVTVDGLRPDSRQSDKAILTALDKAGARMSVREKSVTAYKSDLKAFEFDSTESPDLFPPLVVLSACCSGISGIKGAHRLVHKESNRSEALVEEFGRLGIKVEVSGDYMLVTGGPIQGGEVTSHNDHRIAMALATAALRAYNKVTIHDPGCIGKSYPEFFEDLVKLGVKVYD